MLTKRLLVWSGVAIALASGSSASGQDQFLGQIMVVGGNSCPKDWAEANGQILSATIFPDLYALFGGAYGGSPPSTFALPDLRGRIAMGAGASSGLPSTPLGAMTGAPSTTLTANNLPAHSHQLPASSMAPSVPDPSGAALGVFGPSQKIYASTGPLKKAMAPGSISSTGAGQLIDQHQPSLVLRYCVAVAGTVPKKP